MFSAKWQACYGIALGLLAFARLSSATTLTVSNTNDSGPGSLRQAIQNASPAGGDTIVFQIPTTDPNYSAATQVFTIVLMSAELLVAKSLTIDGSLQKIVVTPISALDARLFNVTAGPVTIANITMAEGRPASGAGGGIRNAGSLVVRGCTLLHNRGVDQGGGIYNAAGATLTVENCTLVNNFLRATSDIGGSGGGIYNLGSLTVRDSTITGNNCIAAQGKNINSPGGGIYNANGATARVSNTILSGNTARFGWNAWGAFISDGYNILAIPIQDNTGFGATGDQVGVTGGQVNLGPLQDNGGPTRTMRPQTGSVAIDQGNRGLNSNNQPINTDQRGYPRPVDRPEIPNAMTGDASDIGAVETSSMQHAPTFTVTNTDTHNDTFCSTDDCTLREAIAAANADPDASTIVFAPAVSGVIDLSGGGEVLFHSLNIIGPGARNLTISGGNLTRLFVVDFSAEVAVSGLTFTQGRILDGDGGALYNSGTLTLTDCTISNSAVVNNGGGGGNGGGLFNDAGATATLTGCTFFSNLATQFGGGAVCTRGTFSATNCTFAANQGPAGGGILALADNGNNLNTLRNCTIAGNIATATGSSSAGGGGYYGEGGPGNGFHHFLNTILAGNTNANNPDLRGFGTTEGNNLIGNLGQGGSGFTHGVNGDKVGTSAQPLNAQFGSYGSNGGPTDTWSLLANSVAINMGNDALAPATDQRGFARNGVSDMGAFEFNGVPPPVPVVSAVSRKTHGSAGIFDINLPLTGSPGVECRSGGANGDFTIIFSFTNTIASVGSAAVTSGAGFVSSSQVGIDAHQYVVNVSAITNAQRVTITLFNVTDSLGYKSTAIPVSVGMLIGDTNADGSVNSADISQTKSKSGQTVDGTNLRNDVTVDGSLNSADVSLVKSRSGTGLVEQSIVERAGR